MKATSETTSTVPWLSGLWDWPTGKVTGIVVAVVVVVVVAAAAAAAAVAVFIRLYDHNYIYIQLFASILSP